MAAAPDTLTVTVLSHPGAVRTVNEDAVTVAGLVLTESRSTRAVQLQMVVSEPVVVAVADGLGGHAAGEVASGLAVRTLAASGSTLDSGPALTDALVDLSAEIARRSVRDPRLAGMATTIVGLVTTPERMLCFNVGDSPAYRLDGGYLSQLATLDNLSQALEDAGETTARSAVVTQVLGATAIPPLPHVREESVRRNACYLLCSDGLSDLVAPGRLEDLLRENAGDDARAVRALWAAAMNAGGRDNITVALVRRG